MKSLQSLHNVYYCSTKINMENETFFFYRRSTTFSINDYTNPQANKKKSTFLILVIKAKNPLGTSELHPRGRGQFESHPRKQGTKAPKPFSSFLVRSFNNSINSFGKQKSQQLKSLYYKVFNKLTLKKYCIFVFKTCFTFTVRFESLFILVRTWT